jgi:metal-sulfur cluster biosynthetic enzyme
MMEVNDKEIEKVLEEMGMISTPSVGQKWMPYVIIVQYAETSGCPLEIMCMKMEQLSRIRNLKEI